MHYSSQSYRIDHGLTSDSYTTRKEHPHYCQFNTKARLSFHTCHLKDFRYYRPNAWLGGVSLFTEMTASGIIALVGAAIVYSGHYDHSAFFTPDKPNIAGCFTHLATQPSIHGNP